MSHVLIIDDEEAIREPLSEYLEIQGYDVTAIADGDRALRWLESNPTDIVVLDFYMPGPSGVEVLEVIRKEHPQVPVIMVSGYADEDLARHALQMGAYEFLPKPLDLKAVEARILLKLAVQEPASI